MQSSQRITVSNEFLGVFRKESTDGVLQIYDFIQLALYHPQVGYYTAKKLRVGRNDQADFYTSSSIGPVFANLVMCSACEILRSNGANPPDYHFLEIGSEPNAGIAPHFENSPFLSSSTCPIGSSLEIPPKSIVFSNELFDAQPFQRFQWIDDQYRPLGVRIVENHLEECILDESFLERFQPFLKEIPPPPSQNYLLDLPIGSAKLLDSILSKDWSGLFLAFDYGLSSNALFNHRPKGTARSYFQHQVSSDFLSNPGKQDITHHLLWDDFSDLLQKHAFKNIQLNSQEAFFMNHAMPFIAPIVSSTSSSISPKKQSLTQLLHPHHMGAAFQVASAFRS